MRGIGQIGLLMAVMLACHSTVEGSGVGYRQKPPKKVMKMMEMIKEKMMMKQYQKKEEPRKVATMPDERCKKVGQFLAIPGEQCIFHVCDYGHEPWRDAYGNIKLFTIEMPCAPGTYVQGMTAYGYPCTGRNNKMCLPKKKSQPEPQRTPPPTKPQMMYEDHEAEEVTQMMEKQMETVKHMDFEQVLETVKKLGEMLESQMYTVLELTPKSQGEKMDVMVMKDEVDEMSYKADNVMKGEEMMSTEEMKGMCMRMMDMMMDMVEMQVEMKTSNMADHPTGYGMTQQKDDQMMNTPYGMMMDMMPSKPAPNKYKPMMMMAPVKDETPVKPTGYSSPMEPEMEMMPQGYGMPAESSKMKKMKKMMKMVESVMDMIQSGYGVPDPMEMMEEKPMMTGYSQPQPAPVQEMMAMMEVPQGYGQMEQMKPKKMKMMRKPMMRRKKMKRTSGYGTAKPKKMRKMQKRRPSMMMPRKQQMKSMPKPWQDMPVKQMKPKPMKSGYGQQQKMKESSMMSYGGMEDMENMTDEDMRQAIYILYPVSKRQESEEMEEMMPEKKTERSYWK